MRALAQMMQFEPEPLKIAGSPCGPPAGDGSEVESDLGGQSARGYVVRAAEGGEEVVERVFVGEVDAGQTQAPFVFVAIEEIVLTDRGIEEVARRDTRRVLVVILGTGSGDANEL